MTENKFSDAAGGRRSAEAIKAAASDGTAEGFTDNSFKPDESMTREQTAVTRQRMKRYFDENYEKKVQAKL